MPNLREKPCLILRKMYQRGMLALVHLSQVLGEWSWVDAFEGNAGNAGQGSGQSEWELPGETSGSQRWECQSWELPDRHTGGRIHEPPVSAFCMFQEVCLTPQGIQFLAHVTLYHENQWPEANSQDWILSWHTGLHHLGLNHYRKNYYFLKTIWN